MKDRAIKLDKAYNFRDFGGYLTTDNKRVKSNLLFRSDTLSNLTEADVKKIEDLNLDWVIDYRTDEERYNNLDKEIKDTNVLQLNPINLDNFNETNSSNYFDLDNLTQDDVSQLLINENINFVESDSAKKAYAEMIRTLIKSEGAVLQHCTAGKDRTGYGAALVLLLLNVSREDVMKDYLLTNELLKQKPHEISELDASDEALVKAIEILMYVNEQYLNAALDLIENKYGGAEAYAINELGISVEELEKLRNKYLGENNEN